MREGFVYGLSGLAAIFIFGYSVHMFVGGLVSTRTEIALIAVVSLLASAAVGALLWTVFRQQR
ncbi:MAG: hypothetical protein D6678_08255 [Zetaproteobacteria bacterium]|nr:MAG: hypothetical protein D6678_08255 [Zetaproteobacteria bacterium]